MGEQSNGDTTAGMAHHLGAVFLRERRIGARDRRSAGRSVRRRSLVEHGQPGVAYLREQQCAAARPQHDAAPTDTGTTRSCAHRARLRGQQFFPAPSFLTGLTGGLIGSWLFGHSGYAADGTSGSSAIGTLLELLVIGLLIYFAVRLFRRQAFSNGWPGRAPLSMPRSVGASAVPAGRDRGRDINLSDADLSAFQAIHAAVQEAWSAGDLGRLRRLMTPEMLSYFSQELTRNASQGVQNIVSDVQLLKGELTESWEERDLQYATAYMRWRAHDYVIRLGRSAGDPEAIVSGNPRVPVEAEEVWTFVRRRGGDWLLSAIQQV